MARRRKGRPVNGVLVLDKPQGISSSEAVQQVKKLFHAQKVGHTGSLDPLAQFEQAETHDELWNAAQREIRQTGVMHNYMRMLWGKKILHWTESPQEALSIMIHLNNKYGLDGRDPNSYSGVFWVLGRYDRAWGPEKPVFGSVRYMTSDSARRKLRLKRYLRRFSGETQAGRLPGLENP